MTTDLQKAADETAKLLTELQDSTNRLKIENGELQNQVQNLTDSYVRLQEAAGRALAERDYYMRECAELTAKFTTFSAMAREALETHRMAPFRPNGGAPRDEPAAKEDIQAMAEVNGLDDAIPAFLTKPVQESEWHGPSKWNGPTTETPAKPEGSLKLRRKV